MYFTQVACYYTDRAAPSPWGGFTAHIVEQGCDCDPLRYTTSSTPSDQAWFIWPSNGLWKWPGCARRLIVARASQTLAQLWAGVGPLHRRIQLSISLFRDRPILYSHIAPICACASKLYCLVIYRKPWSPCGFGDFCTCSLSLYTEATTPTALRNCHPHICIYNLWWQIMTLCG